MYKEELALNNQQWLICHKTKPNKYIYKERCPKSYARLQIEEVFPF